MTVTLAAKLGLAASVFITSTISGEAALPKDVPSSQALLRETIIRPKPEIKPKTALDYACENPTTAFQDSEFYYIKDEIGLGAYKMLISEFNMNYNPETQTISFPINTPRVLCPI